VVLFGADQAVVLVPKRFILVLKKVSSKNVGSFRNGKGCYLCICRSYNEK
jgi:hypothetical protein